jgi:Putative zinc-finger
MNDLWNDRLSAYLDDDLDPADRAALEEHVRGCAACSRDLEALHVVKARARSLESRGPAADLWPGIRERIADAAPEPITAPKRSSRPALLVLPGRFQVSWPQAIAAGISLMLLSGGVVWWAMGGSGGGMASRTSSGTTHAGATPNDATLGNGPASAAAYASYESHYDAAIADLQNTLSQHRSTLDTSTVRVVEQNLAIIDRAILQARRALEADPSSPYLHEHLALEMKLKLDLLTRAMAFSGARG